jgi:hypothetical protein
LGGGLIFRGAYSRRFTVFIYSSERINIANQKSVRYSVSISYFTNIAVQNVNKAFDYITEFTASLKYKNMITNFFHSVAKVGFEYKYIMKWLKVAV